MFVHTPYLVNFASPTADTRERSTAAVRHALARGALLGAQGVIIHAGAAMDPAHLENGRARYAGAS